ncbi:MAG: ABC transporter ATP-binding protein, partial [Gammaproteobacteria bacterium]|nr:ABC transporter ATP-binding protein [Gammaproteobacteria bacterium]
QSPGWRDAAAIADAPAPKPAPKPATKAATKAESAAPASAATRKRSYKDQRELDALPAQIEQLDASIAALEAAIAAPEFYQQDKDKVASELARLEALQADLEHCYERWAALE